MWCCLPIIPTLGRPRQEERKGKINQQQKSIHLKLTHFIYFPNVQTWQSVVSCLKENNRWFCKELAGTVAMKTLCGRPGWPTHQGKALTSRPPGFSLWRLEETDFCQVSLWPLHVCICVCTHTHSHTRYLEGKLTDTCACKRPGSEFCWHISTRFLLF